MKKPVLRSETRRTCPSCNSPVKEGYHFCEVCGEQIPELLTCTHCGTQFITPLKYCDLCGARITPDKKTDDGDIPENSGDGAGPADEDGRESSGGYDEEPDGDIIPECPGDEKAGTDSSEGEPERDFDEDEGIAKKPGRSPREIPEPDTQDLLEQFGKEFSDDETMESARRQDSRRAGKNDTEKPARPAGKWGGSPGTADDALFLMETEATETPVKKPSRRIPLFWWGAVIVVAILLAAVYFIGLPMITDGGDSGVHSSVTIADVTGLPEPAANITSRQTPVTMPTPAPVTGSLVPQPTDVIPAGLNIYFQVQKSPITSRILVVFAGSAGHGSISSADVRVTHPDGSISSGVILPLKGVTEITLDGSKEPDRIEVIAHMSDGTLYRAYDALTAV